MTFIDAPSRANEAAGAVRLAERLASNVSADFVPYEVVLAVRSDVLIARYRNDDGTSVIVKLWNRPTLKGALRRLTRTNAGYREWRTLNILHRGGVSVPRPLAYVRLLEPRCRHTEALLVEDLGDCRHALARASELAGRGDWCGLEMLETDLIETTTAMLDCGIVDVDHRMNNFIVTPGGRVARVDLEHGRSLSSPLGRRRMGVMLGTLVGSYIFAVQPRLDLAESFAHRLAERLGPTSQRVLRRAGVIVEAMLRHQRLTCGVDSRVALNW